jgi:signal recognition particle subunit SRP54
MFDALSERLDRIASSLRSRGRISERDLDEALSEIRSALLDADVELSVVRLFLDGVRERCQGEALSKSLTPGQQVIKAVNEELIEVLGGEPLKITYASKPPTVILLAGLQGAGKTTAAAKLATWFKSQGRSPLLVAADLQRPAAVEQLRVLGGQAGVPVFTQAADPVAVAVNGVAEAARVGRDVVIIDTAGRLSIDEALMDEVRQISKRTSPHYTFLVIDAMTGQDAVGTAKRFHDTLGLDGVIVTKLDGDARGGVALSVKTVVGKPIVFASVGERLADLDLFYPDRMASRILGMGDVLSLIEQAEKSMDADVVKSGAQRMMGGTFTLEDFLSQLGQVRKMGSLGGLMRLMPGMNKEMRQAADQLDDREVDRIEAIVRSMTPKERNDPDIIDGSRRMRIATGSGTSVAQVNQLLRQFKEMQKMMKGMAGGAMPNMPGMGGMSGKMARAAAKRQMGGDLPPELASLTSGSSPTGLSGPLSATGAPRPAQPTRPGNKKKKGGRVTPPKQR